MPEGREEPPFRGGYLGMLQEWEGATEGEFLGFLSVFFLGFSAWFFEGLFSKPVVEMLRTFLLLCLQHCF